MRGRQPAAEAALLHPPLRELRLKRHCYGVGQTNYPECLKYYHGKANVIISETMIFQNSMLFTLESGRARDSRLENLNREDGEAEAAEEEAKT